MTMTLRSVPVLAAALLASVSCGGDDGDGGTDPNPPVAIAAVSGNGQTGVAGTALAEPLTVRVTDASAGGVGGVSVAWAVTAGGGSVSSASTSTSANGQAGVTLTLGPAAGMNTVTASVSGLSGSPVTFTATATAPPVATTLELISGDGQNGKTTEALGDPLVVRVLDQFGAPVPGVDVAWAVTSGAGSVQAATSTTSPLGLASIAFTPGAELGTSTVEASVPGLAGSPQTFTVQTTVWLVRIDNFAFVDWDGSNAHTIAVGDTIEWVNRDNEAQTGPHTVTSSSEPAGGSPFDSGNMVRFDRFRFVPQVAGTWDYFCEIHGAGVMSGTLTAQ